MSLAKGGQTHSRGRAASKRIAWLQPLARRAEQPTSRRAGASSRVGVDRRVGEIGEGYAGLPTRSGETKGNRAAPQLRHSQDGKRAPGKAPTDFAAEWQRGQGISAWDECTGKRS